MKILHVFDHSIPIQDGYSTRSRCIIQQQNKFGWQTAHLTGPKQGECDSEVETEKGIRFYRTTKGQSIFHKMPVVQQLATIHDIYSRLQQVIETEKPDILHAHSPSLNGVATALAAKKANLPFVYEIRAFWEDAAVDQGTNKEGDFRYKLTRSMENWVVKRANAVFTICKGLKNDLESRNIVKGPIVEIPNAVDMTHLSTQQPYDDSLASKFGLTKGKTLGFIGSFYDYEGLDFLIQAMPSLLEKDPELRLLLVGTGNEFDNLRSLSDRLGLLDKVIFTGKVPYEEVKSFYSIIDILVYPRKSLRLTELVTPLKPLEAMAQNRLFIASDVGGHKELVTHKKSGMLFKSGSIESFISVLFELIGDSDLQKDLVKQGYEFVSNERNWPVSVENYRGIYESVRN